MYLPFIGKKKEKTMKIQIKSIRGSVLFECDAESVAKAVSKCADLRGANLRGADLIGANLCPLQKAKLSIVPDSGSFTAWKKCCNDIIVKLEIPADSKRSSATGRKCRAEFVKVLEIVGGADIATSIHDCKTVYRVGEIVKCDKWEEDRFIECGGGIHFYITKEEAEAHN